MSTPEPPLGLIAAGGMLPLLVARGARSAGRRVVCVGMSGFADPALADECDEFGWVGMARPGSWARRLRSRGVRQAVMVGRVQKTHVYVPLWRLIWRFFPDLTAARVFLHARRSDMRTDSAMSSLAEALARKGVTLIDTTRYIPDHLASPGPMTRRRPSAAQSGDIAFGVPIARRMGELDVGQSIAVKDRDTVAVEAIEGTDAMIRRAGELCRGGGWVLVKLAKPEQDLRFDVPVIGVETVRNLKAAGGACIAVEAGRVIMLDKPAVIAEADRLGVCIVGVE